MGTVDLRDAGGAGAFRVRYAGGGRMVSMMGMRAVVVVFFVKES